MKILVSDDVSMKGVDLLRENGYEVDVKKNLDEQGLIDCIGEYDGLITRSMTHVTEKVIEAATKLKVIGRAGVGVDSIDLKSATVRGIVVVNTPTSNTLAATEHTCAMIMAITRHIPQAHNSLMAGNWDRKTFTGIQLQNKTIGIIGGTGSAKTSLVQLLPRLYDTTAGHVYIGGVDVRDYDLEILRNSVAMVLQKNELFSGTIAENLRWGNKDATDAEIEEACKQACADEFIERFPDKYNTHIDQGGTNVSGGQKQRLCIARALLKKPRILILDEATSSIDTRTEMKIQEAFQSMMRGRTSFIVAHRISTIREADVILVMKDGNIIEQGSHEELLEKGGFYKNLYESQFAS